MTEQERNKYIGKSFEFEDGNSITIIQIKRRDEEQYWVTYQVVTGPGVPARFVLEWNKFIDHYGHLFQ